MISKELLENIICSIDADKTLSIPIHCENLTYCDIYGNTEILNIHNLANKCKIWALEKGYCLISCIHEKDYCICEILIPIYNSSSLFDELLKTTDADTEPEAIFKACQWILDNNKRRSIR